MVVKGLITPSSRWLQGSLFSKTKENTNYTLLHHPFLFKGKPTHAQEVALANRDIISPIGIVRDVEVLCGKIKYATDFLALGSP